MTDPKKSPQPEDDQLDSLRTAGKPKKAVAKPASPAADLQQPSQSPAADLQQPPQSPAASLQQPSTPAKTPPPPPASAIPTAPPLPKVVKGKKHTVKAGENLSQIAQQYYGSAAQWILIYEANKAIIGDNPNLIRAGMVLVIPNT